MSRRDYFCARMWHADWNMLHANASSNPIMAAYWSEIAEGWAIWIRHFDRKGWT